MQIESLDKAVDKLNWYNFNKNNKLLYIITKADTARGRKLKFSGKWAINYDLGWAVSYFRIRILEF